MTEKTELDPRGLKWMGPIPRDWSAHPVKRHYHIQLGKMLQNNPSTDTDRLVPYVKALYVLWSEVRTDDLPEMYASTQDVRQYGIDEGDLLVCEGGEVGRAGIVHAPPENCIIQNALHRVRARNSGDVHFLQYVLHSVSASGWFDVLCNRATIAHFTREKFADLRIPLPRLEIQRAIAAFLDRETARIDALIEKKQRQIELLQEKRAALISYAVTKGLDANVKMKDSYIGWIGEIPAHWSLLQLRRVVSKFVDYRGKTPKKTESGIPLITAGAVKDGQIDHTLVPEFIADDEYDDWMVRGKPEQGDVVITTEAPLGEVGQVFDTNVAFAQRIILFKVNATTMIPEFLRYYYLSINGRSELLSRASGSTASGIRADRLKMSTVIVPPLDEQRAIVEYFEETLKPLLTPRFLISESIVKLRELRTALISAAVTGKIDVRKEVS
jgi:type I restriction enzyme S subunit